MSSIPDVWIHGSAQCATNLDVPLQVHPFEPRTFIIRQNKCQSFEAPFMYLLVGTEKARPGVGHALPIRSTVDRLLPAGVSLIVAHSHAHQDHTAGDDQFVGRQNTFLVEPSLTGVRSFFGFPDWPRSMATLNLGERTLSIVGIPGHESSHIAIHAAAARILLTGDTLYPGLLTIDDWPTYRQSAQRLSRFATDRDIDCVLGAHVEMKKATGELYPIGATFQPEEHVLQLNRTHLDEWHHAVATVGDASHQVVLDDFILQPQ